MTHTTSQDADDTVGHGRSSFWTLTLGSIGVVYGDIGTSPLYAFREAARHIHNEAGIGRPEIFGLLSIILWILIINVTCKYVLFLLRIDNRGEGGSLSLMALARKAAGPLAGLVFFLGLLGASLFYGEAAITPAISVLSAVEGLKLIAPGFAKFILPLVVFILLGLFAVQKFGTGRVSIFFGPITTLWFLTIGAMGAYWLAQDPEVIQSFNPVYAIDFLRYHPGIATAVMGAAFLAVTGTEALYIDLGHFGRKPIQTAWLGLVFPCLVLNYLGQGAMVLKNPSAVANSFYLMAPGWLLAPLIVLATLATIIASQAVITGAFSMAQQAIQFGLLPRMEIRHTSASQEGQIYMPKINRTLLWTVLLLVLIFQTSDRLAAAYGLAVNGTMLVTTTLAFIVIWRVWRKNPALAALTTVPFACIELAFLYSNLLKFLAGGFVPILIASSIILLMWTWVKGTRALYRQAHRRSIPLAELVEMLDREPPARVAGTAIFLTSDPQVAPVAMLQNLKHNHVLHAHNVILTVVTTHTPKIVDDQRFIIEHLSSSLTRMIVIFGYMETPNVPRALSIARRHGLNVNLQDASFFLGRRTIVSSSAHRRHVMAQEEKRRRLAGGLRPDYALRRHARAGGLPDWQDSIYIALAHSSVAATDFFRIPRNQVVEMGTQMAV